MLYVGQNAVAMQLQSLVEYPQRQKPASFNLDTVLETMKNAAGGGLH